MYSTMGQSDPVITFQSFVDDGDESIADDVIFNIVQVGLLNTAFDFVLLWSVTRSVTQFGSRPDFLFPFRRYHIPA